MVHIYLKQTSTDISPLQCMFHRTVTTEQIELPATTPRLTSGKMTSPVYSSADNSISFRRSLNLGQLSITYNTINQNFWGTFFWKKKKAFSRGLHTTWGIHPQQEGTFFRNCLDPQAPTYSPLYPRMEQLCLTINFYLTNNRFISVFAWFDCFSSYIGNQWDSNYLSYLSCSSPYIVE